MRTFVFALIVLLFGSTVQAQVHNFVNQPENTIQAAPVPVPPPGTPTPRPPVPVPTLPHFSYWKPMWDNSAAITNDFLKGDWMMIGRATTNDCNQFKDQSSLDGIKNPDGSDFVSLSFADVPSTHAPVFSATINGMGGKTSNQGPYEVAANEPQFSTFSSDAAHTSWYEWSCRDSQDGNMICASGLRTSDTDISNWSDASRACLRDDYGLIFVYKRK